MNFVMALIMSGADSLFQEPAGVSISSIDLRRALWTNTRSSKGLEAVSLDSTGSPGRFDMVDLRLRCSIRPPDLVPWPRPAGPAMFLPCIEYHCAYARIGQLQQLVELSLIPPVHQSPRSLLLLPQFGKIRSLYLCQRPVEEHRPLQPTATTSACRAVPGSSPAGPRRLFLPRSSPWPHPRAGGHDPHSSIFVIGSMAKLYPSLRGEAGRGGQEGIDPLQPGPPAEGGEPDHRLMVPSSPRAEPLGQAILPGRDMPKGSGLCTSTRS